jgi:hypothetical protein
MKSRAASPCQRKRGSRRQAASESDQRVASTNDWPLGQAGVASSKLIVGSRRYVGDRMLVATFCDGGSECHRPELDSPKRQTDGLHEFGAA